MTKARRSHDEIPCSHADMLLCLVLGNRLGLPGIFMKRVIEFVCEFFVAYVSITNLL